MVFKKGTNVGLPRGEEMNSSVEMRSEMTRGVRCLRHEGRDAISSALIRKNFAEHDHGQAGKRSRLITMFIHEQLLCILTVIRL